MRRERANVLTRAARRLLGLPRPVLDRLIGAPPVTIDGRVLSRPVQALIALGERTGNSVSSSDVTSRRRDMRRAAAIGMPTRLGIHVVDRFLPGPAGDIGVRIYRRLGEIQRSPAIIYFHGGGWVVGDLDTHDGTCRLLADVSGCAVIAVDYRLAPEHRFPAAVDDAVAAFRWIAEHHDDFGVLPGRIGVMGDSAGGNLAAVVAQRCRHDERPPVAQVLVYPATNAHFDSESHRLFAAGFVLSREDMEWFRGHYLPEVATWDSPAASPLLADDLRGVAPALVVTAGFDPLRDEGAAYAERLEAADVPCEYRCYDDLVHGFFGMGVLPDGMAIISEICAASGKLMFRC
ncbi:MAG: alpha/beta hydrolase [Actinobacteria bacterium]|nr:alpha/beta hydrolase [Actinomycetota bacterium]